MENSFKDLDFYGDFRMMLKLAYLADKITSEQLKEKERQLKEIADREMKLLEDKSEFINSIGKLLGYEQ